MVNLNTLGIHSLKIHVCSRNSVKVCQPCASIRKGVNFGVQGFQRFVAEDDIGQLRIFTDERDLLDE